MSNTVRPGLTLRSLQAADHELVWKLMHRIYPPAYADFWPDGGAGYLKACYNKPTFLEEVNRPESPFYLVSLDNGPTGILQLDLGMAYPEAPGTAATRLHRIYLGGEARGRGVGRSLIDWSAERARQHGSALLWLEAMDTSPAPRIYARLGFVRAAAFQYGEPRLLEGRAGAYRMHRKL